jgi:hypothetical protein
LLLLAVLMFARQQTRMHWVFLVLAHALLLTINILTTLLLVLLSVHLVGLAYRMSILDKSRIQRELLQYVCLVILAFITAILLLAPLWFSIIHSFFVTDMVSDFDSRGKWGWFRSVDSMLSVFTPRHFWDNGSHVSRAEIYPHASLEKSNALIAYMGIAASLVSACALVRHDSRKLLTGVLLVMVIFPVVRIFGGAPFVDYIPIVRSIGSQYWGCMAAIALPLLLASGIQRIHQGEFSLSLPCIVFAVQAMALGWLWFRLGWPRDNPYTLYTAAVILLAVMVMGMLFAARLQLLRPVWVSMLLVIVVVLELVPI